MTHPNDEAIFTLAHKDTMYEIVMDCSLTIESAYSLDTNTFLDISLLSTSFKDAIMNQARKEGIIA